MTGTIKQLTTAIISAAQELARAAEALPADAGVHGAEVVLLVRDAQAALNQARDRMALVVGNRVGPSEALYDK